MRKLLYFILIALLFAACIGEDGIPFNKGGQTDRSYVEEADSMGSFELTLTGESVTRATTTVITQEEAENFLVTILKGSDTIRQTVRLKDLNTSLPAGYGYKVFAENVSKQTAITANDGWGQRRYAGLSASFAIKAGQTTAVNVGCGVANSGFEVIFDETIAEYFSTSYSVTVIDGDRTLVFDSTTGGTKVNGVITHGRIAYFNPDDSGQHPITYIIRAVGPTTIEQTGSLDLNKAVISNITVKYKRGEFDFHITLDEEVMLVDQLINITDDDIQVEDGKTDIIAHHDGFTADATSISTRTALSADGTTVAWETGDAIAVYDFTAAKFQFTADISNGRTKFSGNVTPKSPAFAAIYPYDAAATTASSASALSATLPSTQYAVANSFESAANIAAAKGNRNLDGSPSQVTFYNACQLLRFSVPAYAADQISSITLTATTPIAGKLNIDFSSNRPMTSIGSTESKVITILPPRRTGTFAAGNYYITTAPTQLTGFTLAYSCSGKTYSQTSTSTFGGMAGHIYNLRSIDLVNTPTATATHIYANGVLQGTRVQLTTAPIEGGSWSATIKNASGTTVRTLSGTGDLSSAETDASWPYLPKGDYTVSYTYTSSNNEERTDEVTLTVPAPTLSLTVDGYTAHTKYESGDVTAANNCNRLTVYNPSARLSVSNALLTNSNYAHSYSRTFSYNNQTANTSEANNNPTWGNYTNVPVSGSLYTLSVTAGFAGETVTGSKTFRITGLPYSLNFSSHSEWSSSGTISWGGSQVQFGKNTVGSQSITTSSSVNIPQGTKYCAEYSLNIHTATVGSTFTIKVGGQEVLNISESGKIGNISGSDHRHAATTNSFTADGNLTTITCNNSYGSGQTCSYLYGLTVKYGN